MYWRQRFKNKRKDFNVEAVAPACRSRSNFSDKAPGCFVLPSPGGNERTAHSPIFARLARRIHRHITYGTSTCWKSHTTNWYRSDSLLVFSVFSTAAATVSMEAASTNTASRQPVLPASPGLHKHSISSNQRIQSTSQFMIFHLLSSVSATRDI